MSSLPELIVTHIDFTSESTITSRSRIQCDISIWSRMREGSFSLSVSFSLSPSTLCSLYRPPRRITDGLPLPTRGLILDIEPEKEGRASEERRQNADTLTRYPTYPFAFSACARGIAREWGDEKKKKKEETASEEEASAAVFHRHDEKSRAMDVPPPCIQLVHTDIIVDDERWGIFAAEYLQRKCKKRRKHTSNDT